MVADSAKTHLSGFRGLQLSSQPALMHVSLH